jgi:chemotaxis protein histidine kinase CheA
MPDDQLHGVLDAIRTRLQAELDAQLNSIGEQHEEALAAARRQAEADAEQRWASKVDAVRSEWSSRLESEVTAARSEAERRMVAESMRLRVEAEQAASESTARVRAELEQALEAERQRAQAQIEAERQRAERELEAERERIRVAAQSAERSESAVTEARASERQAQLAAIERLLESVRSISSARSLSDMLTALVNASASEAPRAALLIVNGRELQPFTQRGFGPSLADATRVPAGDGMLAEALRGGEPVASPGDPRLHAPAFASLPAERAALAVPIQVGERVVAVLYVDDGAEETPQVPAAWPEAIQILGRHAAACLAYLTAVRTAQAVGLSSGGQAPGAHAPGETSSDDENGARRYARLLVSEIKLYNESAVRLGRQKHDLLDRLRPEIERARRLYEERVSPSIGARSAYFHQELVQTLADGDPALLGG